MKNKLLALIIGALLLFMMMPMYNSNYYGMSYARTGGYQNMYSSPMQYASTYNYMPFSMGSRGSMMQGAYRSSYSMYYR